MPHACTLVTYHPVVDGFDGFTPLSIMNPHLDQHPLRPLNSLRRTDSWTRDPSLRPSHLLRRHQLRGGGGAEGPLPQMRGLTPPSVQGLSVTVIFGLATRRNTARRRTSSPSVHSSIAVRAVAGSARRFLPGRKRPTRCGATCSLSLLGALLGHCARAARCQQRERTRRWHLQLDSLLQSSSHATGGCHVHQYSRSRRQFAP